MKVTLLFLAFLHSCWLLQALKTKHKINFCDKFFININPSAVHFDDFNGQLRKMMAAKRVGAADSDSFSDSGSDSDSDGSAECVARHLLHSPGCPCCSRRPLKCSKCHHWLKRGAINIYACARSSCSCSCSLAIYKVAVALLVLARLYTGKACAAYWQQCSERAEKKCRLCMEGSPVPCTPSSRHLNNNKIWWQAMLLRSSCCSFDSPSLPDWLCRHNKDIRCLFKRFTFARSRRRSQ